nr:hypothetical protein [uncultured Mediterranean phage uvMED]BAR17930.1 hypothetical protein [uncultured Mediterranean phage uvMED]
MATETADNKKLLDAIAESQRIAEDKRVSTRGGKKYSYVKDRNSIFRKHFGLDVSYHSSYELTDPKVLSYKDKNDKTIDKFIPGSVIVKTEIFYKNKFLACGLAQEYRDSNPVNVTSAMENCQTSSLGRALAMLDLTGTEFASADEMQVMDHNKRVVDDLLTSSAIDTQEIVNNHVPPKEDEENLSPDVSLSNFTMISNTIDGSKHLGQLRSVYTKYKNEIDGNEQLQGVYKNHEDKLNRNKPTDNGWDI